MSEDKEKYSNYFLATWPQTPEEKMKALVHDLFQCDMKVVKTFYGPSVLKEILARLQKTENAEKLYCEVLPAVYKLLSDSKLDSRLSGEPHESVEIVIEIFLYAARIVLQIPTLKMGFPDVSKKEDELALKASARDLTLHLADEHMKVLEKEIRKAAAKEEDRNIQEQDNMKTTYISEIVPNKEEHKENLSVKDKLRKMRAEALQEMEAEAKKIIEANRLTNINFNQDLKGIANKTESIDEDKIGDEKKKK